MLARYQNLRTEVIEKLLYMYNKMFIDGSKLLIKKMVKRIFITCSATLK